MATAKKSTTTKKSTMKPAKTRAAAATATTKKAPVKKVKKTTSSKKVQKASKKNDEMRSFHVAKDTEPFMSFRITRQTIYWVILIAFIVFAQLWILSLQLEVASLLDAQQAQLEQDAF